MTANAANPTIEIRSQEQKSALLFLNSGIAQVVSAINACILVAAVTFVSGFDRGLGLWWCLAIAVALLRGLITYGYRADAARHENTALWTQRFRWATACAGLVWGVGAALLSYHEADTQRFFIGLIMVGMVSGAVPLLSSRLDIFRLYAYPAVLPSCLLAFVEGSNSLVFLYGLLALIFILAMDRSATLTYQLVSETIRHSLEEELHAAELEQARAAAEAASIAKSRLLANMSHELRTPLNSVLGFGTLLEHTELSEEQTAYVAMQRQSGEHLLELITDVLELSQLEADMVSVADQPVQLIVLMDQVLEQYQSKAVRKNLSFSMSCDPALASDLMGDQGKLLQILSHLTDNAIKFTEHGRVELILDVLESNAESQRLRFTVSDSGIGIATEELTRIFHIFTQGDDSITRRYGGTGLGLAICRKLADLLGGEIHVDSQPGQGSRFTFTLSLQRLQGSTAP